ncbi:apolipoprotein N-acyltransferase [Cellulosimicrobium cellulans]|uniref:Apolipoprotein N-acyltransferase n=1 Tax=Cellulosimicrobium cellulans TaxID=1710 RepID=A0A4Y4DZE2_CELCE|nr:apolipoprotein N-acyltransferase [Cellulosimicrobium cellulans]GED08718.1 apolipoprotein N-acyltransferase [Cellulosimicrobium cellulans]
MHAPEPTAAPAGRPRPAVPDTSAPDSPASTTSETGHGETGRRVPGTTDGRTLVGPPSRPLTLLLALVGGLVTDAAFPDRGWWPLAFVGVAALFWALRRDGARWGFLVGLVWGLAFFLPHLWWANYATETVPWVALSVMEACFVAVLGAAWVWARRRPWSAARPWAQAVGFALLFVGVEQARTEVPFGGFPWGRLAFSQAGSPLGRAAWLGGEVLVSLLVALAGSLLAVAALALVRRRDVVTGAVVPVVVAGALVAAPLIVPLDTRAEAGTLAVGAVQGNVGEPGLGSFANRAEVLNNHLQGTVALLDQVEPGDLDVVLWPENGSDLDPQTAPDVARAIDDAAREVGAPILVGAQEYPETGGRYNVSLLWEPGAGVVDRYAKQHPAPFGEYIPLRSLLRIFSDQVDRVSIDMIPGTETGVVDLVSERLGRTVPLGVVICFEVAYDGLVNDAVDAGAEVLVVQTNNASFGYTAESTQQLAMSRLRAVSTGRATVQVSTVGVSGIIAPDGTLLQSTGLFTADQLVADLPLRTSLTPAVRAGGWPGRVVELLALGLLAAGVVGAVRERRAVRASATSAATEDDAR